uniref:Uncharacterized protein n=1 Tax=Kalanchoe fedtschenkoi TaxID=63787 RepID=A0A7N0ZW01_KALFE
MEFPNESGKSDHPHGFPDDIFRASGGGGLPEEPWTRHEATDSAGSDAHLVAHPGNPFGDHPLLSFSSRSSSDSSADVFQVDPHTAHQEPMLPGTAEDDVDRDHHQKEVEPDARATDADEPAVFNPRHAPPAVQVMDRSEAYDPSRIPASVFTPRSSSPVDWSVASNESLFSIHVGNNSFSRDQFLLMGMDLRRSGELSKPDKQYKSGELYTPPGDMLKSGELFSLSPSPPPVTIPGTRGSADIDNDVGTPKVTINSATETPPGQKAQPPSLPVSTNLSTISSHSDGSGVSGASARSFAFPVLTEAKRDSTSTEKEEQEPPNNLPEKQASKSSMRKSISEQLSAKIPSCSLCCCYCSCPSLSWPRCWSRCRCC